MKTINSNAHLSAVSGTPQNITLDAVTHKASGQNGASNRCGQLTKGKSKVVQSNNSSSAIRRLPTEILAQIFLYCIPEEEEGEGACTLEPHLAPMLLTTVCRRWREVAVDMPSLWRRLRLEVGRGDWQQKAFCYNSCLKRSRGRKLSLTLECHNSDWTELRSLLLPYVDQISTLSLWFSSGAGSFVLADFRALEELNVYMDHPDPLRAIAQSVAQLPPNMRSLKLRDIWLCFQWLSIFNPFTWTGLTNLEIVVEGLDCLPRVLRLCPNLSTLTMIELYMEPPSSETLAHANLQCLRIYAHPPRDSIENHGLFSTITLPNLRLVEVHNLGEWPHEEFKELLMRSQCPLETLMFGSGMITTDGQLAEYATLFPSIKLVTDPAMCSTFYLHIP